MFAAVQGPAQDLESIRILAMLTAAVLVLFWRQVLKFVIIALVMLVVSLLVAGAFVFLDGIH